LQCRVVPAECCLNLTWKREIPEGQPNRVKRLILVGVTKTDAAPIRDQGLLEGGGQVLGAKLPLSEEIDPGKILCLILPPTRSSTWPNPRCCQIYLWQHGERLPNEQPVCHANVIQQVSGELGRGTGDWRLGALWMKSQGWAEMSAAPVHDDACSLLLLLRGGPWGRELIRNVVIRILAWSKIRKTGGALRRRRARAPGPTPADPVSVRYEAYHSKLVRYGTTVVLSEHDGAIGTCF
jgi:hypothetical protein